MSSASTTPSSSSSKQPQQQQRRVILLNSEETTAATAPTSSTINRKGAGPKRSMRRISISSSGNGGSGASSSSERLDTPKTPVEMALASVSSAQTQNQQQHDMRTIETFLQMCGTEKFSSASSSGSSSHGAASSYSTMSIEKIMETLDTLYHQHQQQQQQQQQADSMNIFHGVQLLRWSVDTDPHLALIQHVKRIYQSEYPYKCDRIRQIYMILKACELIVDHRSKEQIASMNAQQHGNNSSIVMVMHVLEEQQLAQHRCDQQICCARSLDSCLSKQRIVNLGLDQTGKERYSIQHVPQLYRDAEMKIIRDLGVAELLDSVYVALCGMVHICEDGVCRYATEDPVTKQITCSITRRAFTTWSTFSNNPTFDYGVVRKDSDGVIRGTSNVGGENGYDFDDTTNDVLMGDGSGAAAAAIVTSDSSAEDMNDLSDVYSSNGSSSGGNEDARNATVQLMSGTIAKQKKVEPVDLNHCNVPHLRRYVEYHMTFMYNWIKTVWRTKRERLAVVVGSGSSSLGGPSAGSNALFGLSLIQGGGVTANSTSGISLGGSIGKGYASAPTEGGGGHGALTSEESAIVARNRRKERQQRQQKQQQKQQRQTFQRAQQQQQMKSLKRAREVDKEEWDDDNDDESSDIDDSLSTSAVAVAVTEEQSASERAFYHQQSILGGGSSSLASSQLASTNGSYSSSGNRQIFFKQDGTPCDPLGEELSSSQAASVSSARVMLHSVSTAAGPQKYVRIFQKKVTKFQRILAQLEKIHRPLVLPVQSAAASSRVYKLNFAEIKRTVYGALEQTRMLVDRHPSHANDSDEDEENGQDLFQSSSSPTSSSSQQSALDLGSRSAQYTHNIVDVLDPYRIAPNTMSVSSANAAAAAAAAAQSDAAQKTKTRTRGIAEFTYYLSFLLEEPFKTLIDWESSAQQLHESLLTTSSQKSTAMHAWHMPKDPRVVDRYVVKRYGVRVPESYQRNYNKMHAGSGSQTMYHSSSAAAASGSKKRKTNAGGGTVIAAAVDDHRDAQSHVVYAVLEEDARRYRQFFVEAFKIVRTLCPGFYRLVTELDHIIELCKEKRRSLHQRLRELKQDGAIPNVPQLLEYARFLPMNYHVVLHAHMSDEEVAACVDLMYHFWRLCEQSPYVCQPTEQEQKEQQLLQDKQKVRHLNVKNHCIAMLYAMEQGLKIHCHTVIPPHPKFSQRGYLVNLNNINDYGYDSEYRRTNYNSGSYTLTQCIKSLLETRPAHELVYHHCI